MSPGLAVSPLTASDNDNVFYFLVVPMKMMCVTNDVVLDVMRSSTSVRSASGVSKRFCKGSEWKYFQLAGHTQLCIIAVVDETEARECGPAVLQ